MRMPNLAPPVRRAEVLYPHRCVDVHHGTPDELFSIRMGLLHGANYNDPAYFDAAVEADSGSCE